MEATVTTNDPGRDALAAAQAAWNRGDVEGYLALYDDSIRMHGYAPEPMGKDEVRDFYAGFRAAFPDSTLTFDDVFGTGDRLCIRFTMTGTHDGEFMGRPATGRSVAVGGITVLRFVGDRCVERWVSADMLGLLVQLGAVPAPV
jgi:steroid delta-isomerase-like uncharacterized protein